MLTVPLLLVYILGKTLDSFLVLNLLHNPIVYNLLIFPQTIRSTASYTYSIILVYTQPTSKLLYKLLLASTILTLFADVLVTSLYPRS